jgi:hypothetical protein
MRSPILLACMPLFLGASVHGQDSARAEAWDVTGARGETRAIDFTTTGRALNPGRSFSRGAAEIR